MSSRLPVVTAKELTRVAERLGFSLGVSEAAMQSTSEHRIKPAL